MVSDKATKIVTLNIKKLGLQMSNQGNLVFSATCPVNLPQSSTCFFTEAVWFNTTMMQNKNIAFSDGHVDIKQINHFSENLF